MATSWQAHPLCPPEAWNRLQDIVQGLPEAYLLPPQTGEEFENLESCLHQLQGYVLSKSFAMIKISSSTDSKRVQIQYRCIHHSKQTQNNRQLKLYVKRDSEDRTIIQRQKIYRRCAESFAFYNSYNFHCADTWYLCTHPNLLGPAVNDVRTPMPRWYCQEMILWNGTLPKHSGHIA